MVSGFLEHAANNRSITTPMTTIIFFNSTTFLILFLTSMHTQILAITHFSRAFAIITCAKKVFMDTPAPLHILAPFLICCVSFLMGAAKPYLKACICIGAGASCRNYQCYQRQRHKQINYFQLSTFGRKQNSIPSQLSMILLAQLRHCLLHPFLSWHLSLCFRLLSRPCYCS